MSSKFQTPNGTKFQSRVGSAFQAWGLGEPVPCSEVDTVEASISGVDASLCNGCYSVGDGTYKSHTSLSVDGTYSIPFHSTFFSTCRYRLCSTSLTGTTKVYSDDACTSLDSTIDHVAGAIQVDLDDADASKVVRVSIVLFTDTSCGTTEADAFFNNQGGSTGEALANTENDCNEQNMADGGTVTVTIP